MTLQCPHCAHPVPREASFCPNCGGRLTISSATAPLAPVGTVPADAPVQRRGIARSLVISGLLLALVLGSVLVLMRMQVDQIVGNVESAIGATFAPAAAPVSAACKAAMRPFVDQLQELNSRLSVGLNFSDYSERVGDARVAYDAIDIPSLDQSCLTLVGGPAEDAFNAYVRAYNTWNNCIDDIDCDNDKIRPKLQDEWAKATEILTTLRTRLR